MASMIAKDRAYTRHRLPKEWTLDASKLAFTVDDVLDAEECGRKDGRADARRAVRCTPCGAGGSLKRYTYHYATCASEVA